LRIDNREKLAFAFLLLSFAFIILLNMSRKDCLFCKIVAGDIPSAKVSEDEFCVAFNDISPQAPTHVLIVPREHFDSLDKADEKHKETLGHLLLSAARIAREKGFAEDGYRVVINTNADGGQTVFHLHVHLLGGRPFLFPPG
jgi:histidine triad (HIT) family protein